jgi:Sulfotransferase family
MSRALPATARGNGVICHPYRCIFIHVPKTGGISVEHVFLRLVGLTWDTRAPLLMGPNHDPSKGPPYLGHLTATEYVSRGHLSQEQFDAYFKFSFVRNPWDRLVSEYKYRRYPMRMSFKRWLFGHLPPPGFTDAYCHIVPQHEFIYDGDGRLLADFVGRYETLQADFEVVCDRLGIARTTLPHENRSLAPPRIRSLNDVKKRIRRWLWLLRPKNVFPHYTQYYDDESRAYAAELYRKDIEIFGYAFGEKPGAVPPAPRLTAS